MAGIPQSGFRAAAGAAQGTGHIRRPQPLRPGDGEPLRAKLLRRRTRQVAGGGLKRPRGSQSVLTPVILSGGAGTRLWPLSRELYPKQLLPLTGTRTLLQQTVLRLEGLAAAAPLIVCNEAHRFLVAEQLRQLHITP